ncbi:hypothetical protein D9M72_543920 [compost metagenome]
MGEDPRVELLGHGARFGQGQAIGILVAGEAGGEHRLGVGTAVVGGDQQQRRLAIQLAPLAGQVVAGQAGADDHQRCALVH